jgi:hypothetical protein
LGEEELPRGPDPKTIWDGQQATIDATTRAAQASVTIGLSSPHKSLIPPVILADQQIAEIHKAQGYVAGAKGIGATQPAAPAPTVPPVSAPPVQTVRPPQPPPVVRQPPPLAARPVIPPPR